MAAFARCTTHLTVRANSLASISAGRCAHLRSTGHLSSFNLAANSGSRVRSTIGSFLTSITITLTKGLAGLNLCRLHGAHVSVLVESVRSLLATRYCSGTCQHFSAVFHGTISLQVPGDVKFNYFDAEGNMQDISVEDLTKGKKVKG